jgi:hypothetical protein
MNIRRRFTTSPPYEASEAVSVQAQMVLLVVIVREPIRKRWPFKALAELASVAYSRHRPLAIHSSVHYVVAHHKWGYTFSLAETGMGWRKDAGIDGRYRPGL